MRFPNLHSWNVTPREAIQIQRSLADRIETRNSLQTPKIIAGADISMSRGSATAYAGVVLLDAETLEVIDEVGFKGELTFPYIPGLLSFREAPLLLKVFAKLRKKPDLVFLDGQGLAHPRKLGLACHLGLWLDSPTIGCAKSRLIGEYEEPEWEKGSFSFLKDDRGKTLGAALRTRDGCNPMFISIGHRVTLRTALNWVLRVSPRYRIPEPTRLAHHWVNHLRKKG